MPTYKVLYDFRRRFWTSYGRVLFVEAVDVSSAEAETASAMSACEPGAEFSDVEVVESTPDAALRHAEKVAAHESWMANVKTGIPNLRVKLL